MFLFENLFISFVCLKANDMPLTSSKAYDMPLTSSKAYDMPLTSSADEQTDDIYWQPAKSVEKLYAQFDGKRFRRILRSEIVIHGTLGSG